MAGVSGESRTSASGLSVREAEARAAAPPRRQGRSVCSPPRTSASTRIVSSRAASTRADACSFSAQTRAWLAPVEMLVADPKQNRGRVRAAGIQPRREVSGGLFGVAESAGSAWERLSRLVAMCRHLKGLGHLRQLGTLADYPIGLPQLPDDLLRRVTTSLHARTPLTHSTGSMKLSHRSDRTQGVGPPTTYLNAGEALPHFDHEVVVKPTSPPERETQGALHRSPRRLS